MSTVKTQNDSDAVKMLPLCLFKKIVLNEQHFIKKNTTLKCAIYLTYEELAVELEVDVPLGGCFLHRYGVMVHAKKRLFDVALGQHVVPALVVKRDRSLYTYLEWPVSHIKGEDDFAWHWKHRQKHTLL